MWAAALSSGGAPFDSWNGESCRVLEGGCIGIGEIWVSFCSRFEEVSVGDSILCRCSSCGRLTDGSAAVATVGLDISMGDKVLGISTGGG